MYPGERRRPAQSTVANPIAQRAPVGIPRHSASNAPFSHIQVIPNAAENPMDDISPQPTFRKPSLAQEADSVLSDRSNLRTADSIANNTLGTTFAAKARAAELQAARARQERREKEEGTSRSTSPLARSHEIMTFTKGRAKGGRTWRPLNLDDLPKGIDDEGKMNIGPYHAEPSSIVANSFSNGRSRPPMLTDTSTSSFQPNGLPLMNTPEHLPNLPRLATQFSNLSPDSRYLADAVNRYDASQWDPEFPPGEPQSYSNAATHPETLEVHEPKPLPLFTLMMPVLNSPSEEMQQEADFLADRQFAQLAELQAELEKIPSAISEGKRRDSGYAVIDRGSFRSGSQGTSPLEGISALNQSSGVETAHFNTPFTYVPPSYPNPPMAGIYPGSSSGVVPSYSYAGPARPKPPHQYPAVKGTGAVNRSFPYLSSDAPKLEQEWPGNAPLHERYSQENRNQIPPIRRLSATEKKSLLMQQLSSVVESSNSSSNASSSRTVLHDPYAAGTIGHRPPTIVSHASGEDIFNTSEPLPWRDRPVDVRRITPDPLALIGHGRPSAPVQPMQPRLLIPDDSSQMPSARSLADAAKWFRTDARFDLKSQEHMMEFLYSAQTKGKGVSSKNTQAPQHEGSFGGTLESKQPAAVEDPPASERNAAPLMLGVLANLKAYQTKKDYFNKLGEAPAWAIDSSPDGNKSFFGEDWGAPPRRVGRDPRYAAVQHDGRNTVYEDFGGRWGNDFTRRYR